MHTKGKWEVNDRNCICAIESKQRIGICLYSDGAGRNTTEANARIIAAAPELLEACKAWVAYLDSDLSEAEKILLKQTKQAIEQTESQ